MSDKKTTLNNRTAKLIAEFCKKTLRDTDIALHLKTDDSSFQTIICQDFKFDSYTGTFEFFKTGDPEPVFTFESSDDQDLYENTENLRHMIKHYDPKEKSTIIFYRA